MLTLLRKAGVSVPCTMPIGLKTLQTLAQVCSMYFIRLLPFAITLKKVRDKT